MNGRSQVRLRLRAAGLLALMGSATVAALSGAPEVLAATPSDDGRLAELVSADFDIGRGSKSMPPVLDPAGDRLILEIDQGQSDSNGSRGSVYRIATRGTDGWHTVDATPRNASDRPPFPTSLDAWSPQVSQLITSGGTAIDPARPAEFGVFAVNASSLAPRLLAASTTYVASSRSTDVVFVQSTANLAPGAEAYPDGSVKLYRVQGGRIALASNVPPSLLEDPTNSVAPILEGNIGVQGFATTGNAAQYSTGSGIPVAGGRRHLVSEDGSRLFFQAGVARFSSNYQTLQPLWLADGARGAVPVSRSTADGTLRAGQFIGASPDGGTAFFVTGAPLASGEQGGGVYRYVEATGELDRLTPDIDPGTDEIDGFARLGLSSAWTSDDASTLFFVATSALADGAVEGAQNAYVWDGDGLRFVADVGPDGSIQRVSRDGRFALFQSSSALTGAGTGDAPQLFRYETAGAVMQCASCRADGTPNQGAAGLVLRPDGAGLDFYPSSLTARGITDDGHVLFTSLDRLVPADLSERADVYEFTGDRVRLLSSGQGVSYLADNTDDGQSVFIVSTAPLTAEDRDPGDFDLFVRRSGGGFPEAASTPSPCMGDGCQGAATTSQPLPSPGSDRTGPGNVDPSPRAGLLGSPGVSKVGRRTLALGGRAKVSVRLRGPGRLTVTATARISGKRRQLASAKAAVFSSDARTASVAIRLSTRARRALKREGHLRISITARIAAAGPRTTNYTLRGKGR